MQDPSGGYPSGGCISFICKTREMRHPTFIQPGVHVFQSCHQCHVARLQALLHSIRIASRIKSFNILQQCTPCLNDHGLQSEGSQWADT